MDRKLSTSRVEQFNRPAAPSWLVFALLLVVTLLLLAAPAQAAPEEREPAEAAPVVLALAPADKRPIDDAELNFDAPAAALPQQEVSSHDGKLSLRRGMLVGHQALGFGLLALDLGATVLGQLNYNDHFVSGAPTARYQSAHRGFAWATVGTFAATGALAVFAPSAPRKISQGFDRITLHKICMASATAAMAAEAVMGIATAGREGRLNQQDLGIVHLAIGYFTFAALATGFGALVF